MAISSINSVWPFFAHFGVVSSPTKVPCVIYFCSKLISLHSGTEEKICMESLLYNRPYMTVLFGKRLSLPWPWGRVHWFSKHFWIYLKNIALHLTQDHGLVFSVLYALTSLEEVFWEWLKSGVSYTSWSSISASPTLPLPNRVLHVCEILGTKPRASLSVSVLFSSHEPVVVLSPCSFYFCLFILLMFLFFGLAHGMQKLPGQGWNPCHSSDHIRSLTRWATRELPTWIFKVKLAQKLSLFINGGWRYFCFQERSLVYVAEIEGYGNIGLKTAIAFVRTVKVLVHLPPSTFVLTSSSTVRRCGLLAASILGLLSSYQALSVPLFIWGDRKTV